MAEPSAPADLYRRAVVDIEAGRIDPSNRELQRHFGIGQRVAKRLLDHMVGEGVLRRIGRFYELAR